MPSDLSEDAQSKPKTWGSTGVTGLVLHIPSSTYYHRYSVKGKRTYRSLKTKRFPTAKLRLGKKSEDVEIARQAYREPTDGFRTLGDFEKLFLSRLESGPQSAASKRNHIVRINRLRQVWPEFSTMLADRVTGQTLLELREKLQRAKFHKGGRKRSKKFTNGYSVRVVNQTLLTLKFFLSLARERRVIFANPFDDRKGIFGEIYLPDKTKRIVLPSRQDMERVFDELKKPHPNVPNWLKARFEFATKNASEMARLMAFSGMRHMEANAAKWEDISGQRMRIRGTKSQSSDRTIPLIPALANLLDEMRARRVAEKRPLRGKVLLNSTCLSAIQRACVRLKLPKITQHTMRHYFATVCIESGVDIPTVSRWLGHADGGALAMKTYGHLRDEHSIAAAQRVTFGAAPAAAPVVKTV